MYQNDQSVQSVQSVSTSAEPTLYVIAKDLERINNDRWALINTIQAKLHLIADRRAPEDKADQAPSLVNSFVDKMTFELNSGASQNRALENVLNHLSELI